MRSRNSVNPSEEQKSREICGIWSGLWSEVDGLEGAIGR